MSKDADMHLLWILGFTILGVVAAFWIVSGGADAFGISDNSLVGYGINAIGDAVQSFTTSAESKLEKLEPETQSLVRQVIADLNGQGYNVTVGETIRTVAAEKADVAAGKSSAGMSYSWHNIGRAVDLYMVDPATGDTDYNGTNDTIYRALATTAQSYGFRSLAYNADGSRHYLTTVKGKVWDGGHIEYRGNYNTLAEAIAAEGPAYGIG